MHKPHPRGFRRRLAARIKARVRYWVDGAELVHWDDPRNTSTWDNPTFAPIRLLESIPGKGAPVHIGSYSGVHYTVTVVTGGQHHPDWVSLMHAHDEDGQWVTAENHVVDRGPVTIGSDCWVAYEALIMSGVRIGHGAVVAARAVVVKDVEPYAVVGGNPGKVIRYRFEEPVREALLRIAWWDWPRKKVAAHKDLIHSPQVERFVRLHDPEAVDREPCEICANPTW